MEESMKRFYVLRVASVLLQVIGWSVALFSLVYFIINTDFKSNLVMFSTVPANSARCIDLVMGYTALQHLLTGLVVATVGHIAGALVFMTRREATRANA
jgi:hypothetical protein